MLEQARMAAEDVISTTIHILRQTLGQILAVVDSMRSEIAALTEFNTPMAAVEETGHPKAVEEYIAHKALAARGDVLALARQEELAELLL